MNEDSILRKIQEWCQSTHRESTTLGIGDDAAIVSSSGRPVIFCSDLTIEKTHFDFNFSAPDDVGHKALARVLSDLAAMGAQPLGLTLSIAIPKSYSLAQTEAFLEKFYEGAVAISRLYGAPILGGDLSKYHDERDGPLVIDVAAIGETRGKNPAWRRSGARAGDLAFVTGPLGAAAHALGELQAGRRENLDAKLLLRHTRPRPRFDVGERFAPHPVNAAIDISDGLVRDAYRVCRASGLSLAVEKAAVPLFEGTNLSDAQKLALALHGGDDYELLLAVDPSWAQRDFADDELRTIGATCIGRFESSTDPAIYLESTGLPREIIAGARRPAGGHDPF